MRITAPGISSRQLRQDLVGEELPVVRDVVAEIAAAGHPTPSAVDALVAAADGMCTAILLEDRRPDPARIRAVPARALGTDDAGKP